MLIDAPPDSDLFQTKADALVNTVNCVSVMGKGIALQAKQLFPDMYQQYVLHCRNPGLKPGTIQTPVWENPQSGPPHYIINFATKNHWRDLSRYEWIATGFEQMRQWAEAIGITSIACPPAGAGYGGLNEARSREIAHKAFEGSTVSLIWHASREQIAARKKEAMPHHSSLESISPQKTRDR